MKKIFFVVFALFLLAVPSFAQEFEIKNYDVKASVNKAANTVDVQAKMRLINLSGKELLDKILLSAGDKPRLTFFLNPKTKVSAMTVNGATVQFKVGEVTRANFLPVSTDITSAFASAPEFDAELTYAVPVADRSAVMHIATDESFMLPGSFWVPVTHNPYADHGNDTAPFTLMITSPSGKVISAGNRKDENTFEQSAAAQPFFFIGDYEVTTATAAKGSKVEIYAPRGLDSNGKDQIKRLADEAANVVNFYTEYFGIPQSGVFRIISTSSRGLNFSEPGAVAIDESYFRRNVMDQGTIELLAGAAAKSFIDGRVLLRGRGTGMLRDGLPMYFAAQYPGARFGEAQREAAFERYRRTYEPLAKGTDTALLMQSALDRNYTTAVYNKGALVWRLLEKKIGKAAFDNLIRKMLDRQRVDVLSLLEWKAPLCRVARCASVKGDLLAAAGTNGAEIKSIFEQWIETVIVPDFAVGQPQNAASGVEAALVNFGSGDITVEVVATTESGEKIKQNILVKGGEYGAANFPVGTRLARIEVDPDKLYPQKDYSNDSFPRRASAGDLYGQAALAFGKKEYPAAETKLREALTAEPGSATSQALLGRVLLAINKNDEAAKIFAEALKHEPLPLQAYVWAQLGLGQLALQTNKFPEAMTHFRYAAAAELDQATTLAARDGALKAEQGANAVKIPDDIKTFIKQLDDALLQGSAEAVNPFVEQGNLREFIKRVTVSKPTVWATEILRTEVLDADRVAVDVNVKLKIISREGAGRAVYVISRAGGKLKLSEVPVFDVK